MPLFTLLILISLFQVNFADNNNLPVFLLDYEGIMSDIDINPNPFAKLEVEQFSEIIRDVVKSTNGVIIFVENTLCPEDISSRDTIGSPYYHLRQGMVERKVKYFPLVIKPYLTLNHIFKQHKHNVFYVSSGTKLQLRDEFKYLYVFFQDALNETRAQTLRRHDLIMRDIYFVVRQLKSGPIVAFYTGKINPVVVEKISFVTVKPIIPPEDLAVLVVSQGARFRFTGVSTVTPTRRRAIFHQPPIVTSEKWTPRSLSTSIAYTDFELQFNFDFTNDRWMLDNVALLEEGEEVGRTDMSVSAPWGWSYVCGEPLVVVNTRDSSCVSISKYQIQPSRPSLVNRRRYGYYKRLVDDLDFTNENKENNSDEGNEADAIQDSRSPDSNDVNITPLDSREVDTTPRDSSRVNISVEMDHIKKQIFGQVISCGPYFSHTILSGLFVTFICLGITMWGIIMMMSCQTYDKFDDPQGKPLVIAESGG